MSQDLYPPAWRDAGWFVQAAWSAFLILIFKCLPLLKCLVITGSNCIVDWNEDANTSHDHVVSAVPKRICLALQPDSDKPADVRMKCTCTCAARLHSLFTFVYEMQLPPPGNHRCFPYPALSVLTIKPTVPKVRPWDSVLNSDPSIFAGINSSFDYSSDLLLTPN